MSRILRTAAGMGLFALVAASCNPSDRDDFQCAVEQDCAPAEICRQNLCTPVECKKSADCGPQEACVEHSCQSTCTPICEGNCCGEDGCRGSCPDRCGETGQVCNRQDCSCEGECVPRSCVELGKECETWDAGCGKKAECGDCPIDLFCNGGTCEAECVPDCAGKCCGNDGCDRDCPNVCADIDQVCNPVLCACEPICIPKNCQVLGKECGVWDDGCGTPVDCESCTEPASCTADGQCGDVCPEGKTYCSEECVDTTSDPFHCGKCQNPCGLDQVCASSKCQGIDCRSAPCPTGTYCDLGVGRCKTGCAENEACEPNGSCDPVAHTCFCDSGYHLCSGQCVSNRSPDTCGSRCAPCPTTANANTTCNGAACVTVCYHGFIECDGRCVPCSDPNGSAVCDAGSCRIDCHTHYHLCSGQCALDTSPSSCGSRCEPCPIDPNGVATCNGTECGIVCDLGFILCGGGCIPCSDPNGTPLCEAGTCLIRCNLGTHWCASGCVSNAVPETCGDRCDPCPTVPNGQAVCDAGVCAIVCDLNYLICDGGCSECPTANVASVGCLGSDCVITDCDPGFHLCSGICVSNGTTDHCGSLCDPCPVVPNGTPTCDGRSCGFKCDAGFHKCGTDCVSDSSTEHCGTKCDPCPTNPNGTPTCDGTSCGFSCFVDNLEPNNSSTESTSLSAGFPKSASICPADDQDWYVFTLSGKSDVTIETSGDRGDTRLWLYDSTLKEVASDDNRGLNLFSLIAGSALPAGAYYIKVDGNGSQILQYTISLSFSGTANCWSWDADGDDFGGQVDMTCAATAPANFVKNCGDCCDTDADVYPGQTRYYSLSTQCGGYDYDCDGTETRWNTMRGGCSPNVIYEGWLGTVPGCGRSGDYVVDCDQWDEPITEWLAQKCN